LGDRKIHLPISQQHHVLEGPLGREDLHLDAIFLRNLLNISRDLDVCSVAGSRRDRYGESNIRVEKRLKQYPSHTAYLLNP
jgi:hypothetical protein